MPKIATANLQRNKSEARGASSVAMGGGGRPHGTLAVEGKQTQATPIFASPSRLLGSARLGTGFLRQTFRADRLGAETILARLGLRQTARPPDADIRLMIRGPRDSADLPAQGPGRHSGVLALSVRLEIVSIVSLSP
jgi:hypothetical protein